MVVFYMATATTVRHATCPAAVDDCKFRGCVHAFPHVHRPECDECCEIGKSYCQVVD